MEAEIIAKNCKFGWKSPEKIELFKL